MRIHLHIYNEKHGNVKLSGTREITRNSGLHDEVLQHRGIHGGRWEGYDVLIKFSEGILSLTSKLKVILFLRGCLLGSMEREGLSLPSPCWLLSYTKSSGKRIFLNILLLF